MPPYARRRERPSVLPWQHLQCGGRRCRTRTSAGTSRCAGAAYRLTFQPATGTLRLVLLLTLGTPGPEAPKGILAGQGIAGFPALWRDHRSLLRFTLNGGVGTFSDGDPWFGQPGTFTQRNPLVQDPALGAQTGAGPAGSRLTSNTASAGSHPSAPPVSTSTAPSAASPPWRSGRNFPQRHTRHELTGEALRRADLRSAGSGRACQCLRRAQNFTLNDGFLIAQYGAQWNAGPRPGLYLAPRTTHDWSAIALVRTGKWAATGFWLDPKNEYEPIESRTQVVGANLRYNATRSFYGDVTALHVPRSDRHIPVLPARRSARRLTTIAGHLRCPIPNGFPGCGSKVS